MPFNRVVIFPYNLGSESARELSSELDTIRVRGNGRYLPRARDLVVNWGNRGVPNWMGRCRAMLNRPQYVENASAKDKTFETLSNNGLGDVVVPWTRDKAEAKRWLEAKPKFPGKLKAVVCRTLTRANSGRGIELAKKPSELVSAPLYTLYKPKAQEYRVHVFAGKVIDVQAKRKKSGEKSDPYIRNHPNGWVFCRENVSCPEEVLNAACAAVGVLRLDFGAVDVGYHPEFGVSIYEINTAPGIEGSSVKNYANAIREYQLQA